MAKIQIISDVHSRWDRVEIDPDAKMIIAAGDITEGTGGMEWLASFNRPVLYVPGNHEFYDDDITHHLTALKKAAQGTKISIMDRSTAIAGEWRFICTTLWTDHNGLDYRLMAESMKIMNDFRHIRTNLWIKQPENAAQYESLRNQFENDNPQFKGIIPQKADRLNPVSALCLHLQDVDFLAQELAKPWAGKTAIITHHAPSTHSLSMSGYCPVSDGEPFAKLLGWQHKPHKNAAYASSLEYFFSNHKIDMWIHGHLHEGLRYSLYGADVISNPTGYDDTQNVLYTPTLSFELNDPLRHSRLLAYTAKKCLDIQRNFLIALLNAVSGDPLFASRLFPDYERIIQFCRLYNMGITCLLQQSKKDVIQAAFRIEVLNPVKAMPTLIHGARLSPAKRIRHLHDLLTFVQANERRTTLWLDSLLNSHELATYSHLSDFGVMNL